MASKRGLRRSRCKGKIQRDKTGAINEATRLRHLTGQPFDGYPCPHCGHWHVGHRPKSVQDKITARRAGTS